MNVRLIHDTRPRSIPPDPNHDPIVTVLNMTALEGWSRWGLFVVGAGNLQDLGVAWDNSENVLQVAAAAMYAAASPTPAIGNSTAVGTLTFQEGGRLNGDLLLNETYQDVQSTALFEIVDGVAVPMAQNGVRPVVSFSGIRSSAIAWPRTGVNTEPDPNTPIEESLEEEDSIPTDG